MLAVHSSEKEYSARVGYVEKSLAAYNHSQSTSRELLERRHSNALTVSTITPMHRSLLPITFHVLCDVDITAHRVLALR